MSNDIGLTQFEVANPERLADFAARSPRLADLASTHPLLFSALAMGTLDALRHAEGTGAALVGRRLRVVCELAGVPYCLRCVPPELCPASLPRAGWSADASKALAQYIPDDPATLRNWVPGIFFAHAAAGEMFALRLAIRHDLFRETPLDPRHLMPIAMFSWFSQKPHFELHRFIPGRWTAPTSLRRLLNATRAWLYRISCRSYLPGASAWEKDIVKPINVGSLLAYELTDYRSLLHEQQVMDNCLDRYARRIASGSFAIFSLQTEAGERIANFEVAIHAPNGPLVTEVRGPSNSEIDAEIVEALDAWAATSSQILWRRVHPMQSAIDADQVFADLIAPYVACHSDALEFYGPLDLHSLEDGLKHLGDRFDIKSWPVRFERS